MEIWSRNWRNDMKNSVQWVVLILATSTLHSALHSGWGAHPTDCCLRLQFRTRMHISVTTRF